MSEQVTRSTPGRDAAKVRNAELTRRNVELLDQVRALPAGADRMRSRLMDDFIRNNERAVFWVANWLKKQYGFQQHEMDDVENLVRIRLSEVCLEWDPDSISLVVYLQWRAKESVKAWRENNTGFGGAVTVRRRYDRFVRVRAQMLSETGLEPSDEAVVERANNLAKTYADPRRAGVLLTVDEVRKSRSMFTEGTEINALAATEGSVGVAIDVDCVADEVESRSFINRALGWVSDELGEDAATVFMYRTSLDLGLDAVGSIRSLKDVSKMSGLPLDAVRSYVTRATQVVMERVQAQAATA